MSGLSKTRSPNPREARVVIIKKRGPKHKPNPESEETEKSTLHKRNSGYPNLHTPTTPPHNLVRINIRHRGPIRSRVSQIGIIWTTHDISNETELRELFQLHHMEGGPQPRGGIFLQQITRRLRYMDGTEKCWWSELALRRVVDVGWVFEDEEVWLDCRVGGV